jgi:hypothetical protein
MSLGPGYQIAGSCTMMYISAFVWKSIQMRSVIMKRLQIARRSRSRAAPVHDANDATSDGEAQA